jgi:hypothetical protein
MPYTDKGEGSQAHLRGHSRSRIMQGMQGDDAQQPQYIYGIG